MTANEKFMRNELVFQLMHGNAHMPYEDAIKDFPIEHINDKFPNGNYTFWHLLEHIRRTQADILNFCINSRYEELSWPQDYWPRKGEKAAKKDWDKTIKSFLFDQESLRKLALNPKTDIYKLIPWGTGQSIFREVLVVADHNSYHLGEFAIMRQVLATWPLNRH